MDSLRFKYLLLSHYYLKLSCFPFCAWRFTSSIAGPYLHPPKSKLRTIQTLILFSTLQPLFFTGIQFTKPLLYLLFFIVPLENDVYLIHLFILFFLWFGFFLNFFLVIFHINWKWKPDNFFIKISSNWISLSVHISTSLLKELKHFLQSTIFKIQRTLR